MKTGLISQRLGSLGNTSAPLPFECVFAIEVENVEYIVIATLASDQAILSARL